MKKITINIKFQIELLGKLTIPDGSSQFFGGIYTNI
ncbi:MAG: hypothetical protein ACJA0E_000382 [Bermanella sp.]|jgi:hypothetical protein